MFSTSWEKYPSKPVITTLTAAEAEFQRWLQENRVNQIRDLAGIFWQVRLDVHQGPSPNFEPGSFWRIELSVLTHVDAAQLLATGTFDLVGDARLINMLGDSAICIKLKPRVFTGHQIDQLRMQVFESFRSMRRSIESQYFHEIKRRICGEWLDQSCLFV